MSRPNILFIMTDEQRWDTVQGTEGCCVDTPYLQELMLSGSNFKSAYSACPVCVPARRTLMSGKTSYHHGVLMNYYVPLDCGKTLPEILKDSGYQTHLCGKLHLFPERKLYGFCSADWSDGPYSTKNENDYERYLKEHGYFHEDGLSHGLSFNGIAARPWHLEDKYHFTNWCTEKALEFFERRDPSVPFFLNVSYHQPHAPASPPKYYFDKYMNREQNELPYGDWEDDMPNYQQGKPVNAWRVDTKDPCLKEYRAGYYGAVEHIDHQIGRLLYKMPKNTIIIFTSDHGEMLGDHGWVRKRSAYEGSAHIPLFFVFPKDFAEEKGLKTRVSFDEPVELMDIMPTILDLLDLPIPEDLDGKSLVPVMQGKKLNREYIHGECARLETIKSGMQYLTDGKQKYIWYPGLGIEQLFDLVNDPKELHNIAKDVSREKDVKVWRERLIKELEGREEGFVKDGKLVKLDGPTRVCIDLNLEKTCSGDTSHTVSFF